jgi:ribosomal protein S18 acetylase RimI-like enzyme
MLVQMDVRPLTGDDEHAAATLLDNELNGRLQARLDVVHDVLDLDGFGAWDGDTLVGVVTYALDADRVELAALAVAASHRRRGFGAALVDSVIDAARAAAAREIWLVTTNDNVDALRLYQLHGFAMTELRAGAVDRARTKKPSISLFGRYGIPLRDELVLTLTLVS